MRLKPALILVSMIVISLEFIAEFVSNHETLLGAILLVVISGLFIYSIKKSNKNANQ